MSTYINPFDNDNLHQYEYKGVKVEYGTKLSWLLKWNKAGTYFNIPEITKTQQNQKEGIFELWHLIWFKGTKFHYIKIVDDSILTPDYKQYALDMLERDLQREVEDTLEIFN